MFKDSFWRDVLISWSNFTYRKDISNSDEIMKQCLWLNSHICIGESPVFFVKPYTAGLKYICQLITMNGQFIDFEILCNMYDITMMQLNSIVSAIPKEWKTSLKEINDKIVNTDDNVYVHMLSKPRLAALVYHSLNENECL